MRTSPRPDDESKQRLLRLIHQTRQDSNLTQEKRLLLRQRIIQELHSELSYDLQRIDTSDRPTGITQEDPGEFATVLFNRLFGAPLKFHREFSPITPNEFTPRESEDSQGIVIATELGLSLQNIINGVEEDLVGETQYAIETDESGRTIRKADAKKIDSYKIPEEAEELVFYDKRSIADGVKDKRERTFSDLNINGKQYSPTSFVIHSGKGATGGHYTAYIKCDDGQWYFYDDDDKPVVVTEAKVFTDARTNSCLTKYSVHQNNGRPKLPPKQIAGTRNQGNWCWMNALLAFTLSFTSIEKPQSLAHSETYETHTTPPESTDKKTTSDAEKAKLNQIVELCALLDTKLEDGYYRLTLGTNRYAIDANFDSDNQVLKIKTGNFVENPTEDEVTKIIQHLNGELKKQQKVAECYENLTKTTLLCKQAGIDSGTFNIKPDISQYSESELIELAKPNAQKVIKRTIGYLENQIKQSSQTSRPKAKKKVESEHQTTQQTNHDNYQVLISKITHEKISKYLEKIKSGEAQAGKHLEEKLQGKKISKLKEDEFLELLIQTKKPTIFAESAVAGDGSDWNSDELSILGDICFAVPVKIYDNGVHNEKGGAKIIPHEPPIDGELLFVPGALLRNIDKLFDDDGNGLDPNKPKPQDYLEVVDKNDKINYDAFYKLYERRLLPALVYANEKAKAEGNKAFITIPGIGCGQFSGRFEGQLEIMIQKVLEELLKKHGAELNNIAGINFDPNRDLAPGKDSQKINGITLQTQNGNNGINNSQLKKPEQYEKQFKDCKLFSIVAWDHVSWPGNDYYKGLRQTDDGVKAAATNVCAVLTKHQGQYSEKEFKPASKANWGQVIKDEKLQLNTKGKIKVLQEGQLMEISNIKKTTLEVKFRSTNSFVDKSGNKIGNKKPKTHSTDTANYNFKVKPTKSPTNSTAIYIGEVKRKNNNFTIAAIKKFTTQITEKEVSNAAIKIIRSTRDQLKEKVEKSDIELFISIMQKLTNKNITTENNAGDQVGFTAWSNDGQIKKELHSKGIKNTDDMIAKFKIISAEIQKQAKDYFDTAPNRKYSRYDVGARSYRIVQLLPDDFEIGNRSRIIA